MNIKKHGVKLIAITLVVMVVFGYLIYTGVKDTMAYYLTVGELLDKAPQEGVRIGGKVLAGSIIWDPTTWFLNCDVKAHRPVF